MKGIIENLISITWIQLRMNTLSLWAESASVAALSFDYEITAA